MKESVDPFARTTDTLLSRHLLSVVNDKAETEALFLSIGEGIIVTDVKGNISRINQVALDILDLTEEEAVGRWYPDVVIAVDENGKPIPKIDRPITEAFMTGKPVFRKIYLQKRGGTPVATAVTVSPVMVKDKPIGAIQIFRDISEEVRLEKAKNEFIAIASHQLRTPATGVKQYLGMLLEGYVGELTPAQRRYLETAYNSNDRQLRIIDDILKVAAADTGDMVLKKRKVKLVPLIETVLQDNSSKFANHNQTIHFNYTDKDLSTRLDRDAFRMVIENLVDNAHKYTPSGKNITVDVSADETYVHIAIKDQGVGIKRADYDKLFQKFLRLDNPLSVRAGGTGLGLYWVKQVVDLHGGSITVGSNRGRGTVFTVSLRKSM